MARKSKLLAALDAHKERDYEAEKRAKKAKAAEKRHRLKLGSQNGDSEVVINGEQATSPKNHPLPSEQEQDSKLAGKDFEGFSEEEGDDVSQKEESAEDEPASASAGDAESDVPFSELSEEDRADTIPHQRLTINNAAALVASTKRVALTRPKMKFSAHNSLILTSLPPASTSIPDPHDDLTRELEFYRICRTAAVEARTLLKKEKVPFTRPSDYFAEMVKSDEHMGKLKKKMYEEAANKKAAAEARRLRDAKKFGKAVQVAKEQARAQEKKQTLEKIKSLKRKRKGQDTGTVNEGEDLFENIEVDDSREKTDRRNRPGSGRGGGRAGGNSKRQKRDQKFGFGGKKRFAKSGDAASTADLRDFSAKKMKDGGAMPKKRLGKSRRAATAR